MKRTLAVKFVMQFVFTALLVILMHLILGGCGGQSPGEFEHVGQNQQPIIVNGVDWVEASTLTGPLANSAKKVGYLPIPGTSYHCNATLVTADTVMTAAHCIGSSSSARGVKVGFMYDGANADWYSCPIFLGAWPENAEDMSFLRCYAKNGILPGNKYGWVTAGTDPTPGSTVYMIHHNCDYLRDSSCKPTKKMSPGVVKDLYQPSWWEVTYTADSLPFSSGGAVFSADGKLVALHHKGLPSPFGVNDDGYGEANAGIRIQAILDALP